MFHSIFSAVSDLNYSNYDTFAISKFRISISHNFITKQLSSHNNHQIMSNTDPDLKPQSKEIVMDIEDEKKQQKQQEQIVKTKPFPVHWISAAICLTAISLLITAVLIDELFKRDGNYQAVCGWNKYKPDNPNESNNIKWGDKSARTRLAGIFWLTFSILSLLSGATGFVCAIVPQLKTPKFLLLGSFGNGIAAIFALCASTTAFYGGEKNMCTASDGGDNNGSFDIGTSVIIGFVVCPIFWIAQAMLAIRLKGKMRAIRPNIKH